MKILPNTPKSSRRVRRHVASISEFRWFHILYMIITVIVNNGLGLFFVIHNLRAHLSQLCRSEQIALQQLRSHLILARPRPLSFISNRGLFCGVFIANIVYFNLISQHRCDTPNNRDLSESQPSGFLDDFIRRFTVSIILLSELNKRTILTSGKKTIGIALLHYDVIHQFRILSLLIVRYCCLQFLLMILLQRSPQEARRFTIE